MLSIQLIRHGKTEGNRQRRYIGRTDEPLCPQGRQELLARQGQLSALTHVWGSPMQRCVQTKELLCPQAVYHPQPLLRECDFGRFENRNYQELKDDPDYRAWMASMGALPFPEGEDHADFVRRCGQGFSACVEEMLSLGVTDTAIFLHGGSIMAILSLFEGSDRSFYHWQVANGDGFRVELDPLLWKQSRRLLSVGPLGEGAGL